MLDTSDYPKIIALRDGTEITIRLMTRDDEKVLNQFMQELPPAERVSFRDNVSDPAIIHRWISDINLEKVVPMLAEKDGIILANWTLHFKENGWTRHHAYIRGIVTPKWRGKGIATRMIRELLVFAEQVNIERVVIELVEPQRELLQRYMKLGFRTDAVLKDWAKDFNDRYNDLYILSMKFEPAWKKMEELILDYGTHGG